MLPWMPAARGAGVSLRRQSPLLSGPKKPRLLSLLLQTSLTQNLTVELSYFGAPRMPSPVLLRTPLNYLCVPAELSARSLQTNGRETKLLGLM
jgi:hypothetical protein